MTTNHPAHGPVSLERLHQISEILSKAAAQSDGGNLGYAMADAVKVISWAIAAIGAEPIGEVIEQQSGVMMDGLVISEKPTYRNIKGIHKMKMMPLGTKFYTAPPAPVAINGLLPCPFCGGKAQQLTIEQDNDPHFGGDVITCTECGASSHVEFGFKENLKSAWNSRSAMLQAGNSPVTPDGSEDTKRLNWLDTQNKRLNEYYGTAYGWKFDANFQRNAMMLNDSNFPVMTIRQAIDEAISAAPQQEVKSALEHGMQRYAGAMQKLADSGD